MASVNKAIIIGNLGDSPEIKKFSSGDQMAIASVATTDKWRDKQSGEMRESTEWHRVVFNGRLAEFAGSYLKKGSLVYVEGKVITRKWIDQSGRDRFSTEIRCESLQILGFSSEDKKNATNIGDITSIVDPRMPLPSTTFSTGNTEVIDDIPFIDPMRLSSPLHLAV